MYLYQINISFIKQKKLSFGLISSLVLAYRESSSVFRAVFKQIIRKKNLFAFYLINKMTKKLASDEEGVGLHMLFFNLKAPSTACRISLSKRWW